MADAAHQITQFVGVGRDEQFFCAGFSDAPQHIAGLAAPRHRAQGRPFGLYKVEHGVLLPNRADHFGELFDALEHAN